MKIPTLDKLDAYTLAHEFKLGVYGLFDASKAAQNDFKYRSQVYDAVSSIEANIAEGCALATRPEFLHFLEIAMGSLNELESHLLLAWETDVIDEPLHEELKADIDLVRRMLLALIRTIQRHIAEDEQLRQTRRVRADSEHPADAERR